MRCYQLTENTPFCLDWSVFERKVYYLLKDFKKYDFEVEF